MCGRFDQSQTARYYAHVIGWADALVDSEAEPAFNVSPGTFRPLFHLQDGQPRVDDVFWSYRARWAAGKVPVCINARLDKLAGRYWRGLLQHGRALVPAEGWYEWTGEKGRRQPWHIHRADRAPLFMAALAQFGPATGVREETGFVLVTDDASGGMLDLHDRRPLVFDARDAALWLNPALLPDEALTLARACALPADAFAWHPVSPAMNRAGADGPQAALPLDRPAP